MLRLPAPTFGSSGLQEIEIMVSKARAFSMTENIPLFIDYNSCIVKPLGEVDEKMMRESVARIREIANKPFRRKVHSAITEINIGEEE